MMHSDRADSVSKQGKSVRIEALEHRLLLSGSVGGDDGPRLFSRQLTAVGDFNGDGKADLATVSNVNIGKKQTLSTLVVQLGKGDGTFTASAPKVLSANPSAVLAGDFNGDKKLDIALVSVSGGQTTVHVLIGDGNGGFAAPVQQNVGVLPTDNIVAGNINGDGFADLLSFKGNFIWESLNDGTGKLLPAVQFDNPFGASATPVAAGDVDGDGRLELIGVSGDQIVANKSLASTGEYLLTFLPVFGSSIPLAGKRLVLADVNGDGMNDFIALGDGSVSVALQGVLNGQAGGFLPWTTQTKVDVNPSRTLVGDVNGDGKVDLFRTSDKRGFVTTAKLVLIGNGDGTFHKLVNVGTGGHDGHGHDDDDDNGFDD